APQSGKKCHGDPHQKGEKSRTQKSSVETAFRRQLACKLPSVTSAKIYVFTTYKPLNLKENV
ncbi:hypothetical protein, partial [Massilia sp. TWP1-3-3]|uniref:hypothetical protein n=1 Tax=Massilia sp. TWP1-3-3 TaxID=2804573 RepID=UPI003CF60F60